jgi:hypothetical protein
MTVVLSDYIEAFRVSGAAVPIASQVAGSTRTLTDLGTTSTPPRSASYNGTRGAEFRTSSFAASSPQALGTAVSSGLNSLLYVSSKIKTFTYLCKFRPSKTGLTVLSLTPVGGLFSATNMGATSWAHNQPCFVFIRQVAGASRVLVSVMGALFDTTIATQSSGAATTEPSDDTAIQVIGVVVTGSTTTNNQIDSVKLIHVTQTGIRRTYTLGAHRAASLLAYASNPSAGQYLAIGSGTSTTSNAIGTGAKTFTTQSGLLYVATGLLRVWRTSDPTKWMEGTVTSYSGTSLVLNVTDTSGAGTFTDWTIGRMPTFQTALVSTAATAQIQNGGSTNPADGYTITIGGVTYTIKTSVAAATKASATLNFNAAKTVAQTDKAVHVVIAGFRLRGVCGTGSGGVTQPGGMAGDAWLYAGSADFAANEIHKAITGQYDGTNNFRVPASPASGNNSGKDWSLSSSNARTFSTKFVLHSSDGVNTVTIQAFVAGVAGNATTLALADPNATRIISSISGTAASPAAWSATTAYLIGDSVLSGGLVYICVKAHTNFVPANATYWILGTYVTFTGGTDDPPAASVLRGANWAATQTNLIRAIMHTGTPGTDYSADLTTAHPTVTAAANGTSIDLTARLLGTAGNGHALSQSGATFTLVAFAGGVNGADADHVLIGADAAESFSNLIDCLNLTGARGRTYGSPTTLNLDVTASLQEASRVLLASKASGEGGNSCSLVTTVTGLTIYDEFGDKVVAALVGGNAAPPFVAASGARPDNSDLRIYAGGWSV